VKYVSFIKIIAYQTDFVWNKINFTLNYLTDIKILKNINIWI